MTTRPVTKNVIGYEHFLRQIPYQGLQTYEELIKSETIELIDNLRAEYNQARAASTEISESPRPALSPGEARPIQVIQDEIPLYDPEIELNKVLNANPPVQAISNSAPAGSGYFQISYPDDINRFSICLQNVIRQYPKRGIPPPIRRPNEPVQEYGFVMIVENTDADQSRAVSYSVVSSKGNKKYSIPITINLVNPHRAETEQKLHQYLDYQIDHMLSYRMDNITSSTRFIAITNFAIYVSRMAAVGGKEFPIPRKIMTSKNVVIYKADNNLCF
jgi:hypothetical protein